MTPRIKLAIALAIAVVAASCGLQEEDQATALEEVQYDLLDTTTSTTSTTVADRPSFAVLFYWHTASDNRLRIVRRPLAERPSAGQTLSELVAGPLPEDLEDNPDLQNQLDQSMEPRLTQIDDRTFQIQIQWNAEEALTTEQAAELVCTATQFAEIEAVTIVNADDEPFTLSGVGAVAIAGPAKASDFGDCAEEPAFIEVDPADEEADDPDSESTTTTS